MSVERQSKLSGLDPHVLIDALAVIMGHEEKELCKPGHLALVLIHETAATILGSKQKVRLIASCIHLRSKRCCWREFCAQPRVKTDVQSMY